jgi:hypothetical protein
MRPYSLDGVADASDFLVRPFFRVAVEPAAAEAPDQQGKVRAPSGVSAPGANRTKGETSAGALVEVSGRYSLANQESGAGRFPHHEPEHRLLPCG